MMNNWKIKLCDNDYQFMIVDVDGDDIIALIDCFKDKEELMRILTRSGTIKYDGLIKRKNNVSGITGVCFIKKKAKWRAKIMVNKKAYDLGNYDLKLDAIKARRKAEIEFLGDKGKS